MADVELLYIPDCPNLDPARELLRRALTQAGVAPRWREWRIDADDLPDHARGYGSPTVLVDGRDVAGHRPSECGACCRMYADVAGRTSGIPSLEQILAAISADPHNRSAPLSYLRATTEREPVSEAWSDEELMAAYQEGNARAFELLFGRYRDRLFGYFVRRFGDRELAADLFQRSFLRIHRARGDYEPSRSFATWAFSIAANLSKDELKRRHRRPGDVRWDAPEDAPVGTADLDPESSALAAEQSRRLERALAALPDSQREVILLHKVEGLSFPEVADALGEKVEAVKSRAFRGYRALRRLLDEGGDA